MTGTQPRLKLGLIGFPVEHSISPAMQQPALDALGIAAIYELWPTSPESVADRVASIREPNVLGANVTVPHKLAVMDHLDEVSPLARRAGAVNTIVNRDGRLLGDNTDVHGFATALVEACPNAAGRPTLILGAGGAARAVVLALESIGVEHIALSNRNVDRARALAADLTPTTIHVLDGARDLERELSQSTIFVNATTLGWHPGESPLTFEQLSLLTANAVVVDLTYRDTDLLAAARERGLQTLDGLPMLVHQGARALELWTGQQAPVAIMMEAALRARSARA